MDKAQYVIQYASGRFGTPSSYYTDTHKDAIEKYNLALEDYKYVELLQGTPGKYESLMQSW